MGVIVSSTGYNNSPHLFTSTLLTNRVIINATVNSVVSWLYSTVPTAFKQQMEGLRETETKTFTFFVICYFATSSSFSI
ncbi:hypothetical protein EB796_008273 [Bugula neritina]|uniref:Uncharacterized protein n=1 Tax=Bugula neritina TaxID=10212 RepID=A0A7J7K463_BUGNE|nr:hypothetical protein EB796_008273 [Bugula neritina]